MDDDRIRMSDVPTGQIPSAENRNRSIVQYVDILEDAWYGDETCILACREAKELAELIKNLVRQCPSFAKAVAADTNEERTDGD